ncbi:hypothetical protein [Agrobacterium tumefaciens]|uniref:hypothetical protein n=1 Tax=Agrobacterium tumefaciens TaxID=358 RepID=UPI00158677C6|nr:hypothetical protein [Agrobacterium tumefaciens]
MWRFASVRRMIRGLSARRLGELTDGLYASPDYLTRAASIRKVDANRQTDGTLWSW